MRNTCRVNFALKGCLNYGINGNKTRWKIKWNFSRSIRALFLFCKMVEIYYYITLDLGQNFSLWKELFQLILDNISTILSDKLISLNVICSSFFKLYFFLLSFSFTSLWSLHWIYENKRAKDGKVFCSKRV